MCVFVSESDRERESEKDRERERESLGGLVSEAQIARPAAGSNPS